MNEPIFFSLVLIVIFFAAFIRAAIGFGDALIAMPLLGILFGIKSSAPLVALVATFISLIILIKYHHVADFKASWRIIVSSILGIPIGRILLEVTTEGLLKIILGIFIIGFSIYNFKNPKLRIEKYDLEFAYVFGFLSGILGGAYNIVGPAVVVYGNLRHWSPHRFLATLQACFFPAYLTIASVHAFSGSFTYTILKLFIVSIPVMILAMAAGNKINKILSTDHFHRHVNLALFVMGLLLCIQFHPYS